MQQTRIDFDSNVSGGYLTKTIWQPPILDGPYVPWVVHVEGYIGSKLDVTFYHECINDKGHVTLPNQRLETPQEFANFCVAILRAYANFHNICVRAQDVKALLDGFRSGVESAKSQKTKRKR